jgi:hypothetical protein
MSCARALPSCSWSQTLVGEKIVEKFLPIDFAENDTVFDRCLEVRQ